MNPADYGPDARRVLDGIERARLELQQAMRAANATGEPDVRDAVMHPLNRALVKIADAEDALRVSEATARGGAMRQDKRVPPVDYALVPGKHARRRARLFDLIRARDGRGCWYCGGPEEELDHYRPLSGRNPRVTRHKPRLSDLGDLVLACTRCNSGKGDLQPEAWVQTMRRLDIRRTARAEALP